jgi:hypothetical protein
MKKLLTSIALGSAVISSASAALILDEGFDYALNDGDNLEGAPGSAWTNSSLTNVIPYESTGLTYSGLTTSGGSMAGWTTATATYLPYTDTQGYSDTRYFSFLIDTLPLYASNGFRVHFGASASSTTTGYGINMDYNSSTDAFTFYARTQTTQSTGVTLTAPTGAVLVVGKFVGNGTAGGTTTIWINPTNFTSEATVSSSAALTATSTFAAVTLGSNFGLRGQVAGATLLNIDEIRLGATYADLVAVPEPSSFAALAGLGALGFAASRRRRRA